MTLPLRSVAALSTPTAAHEAMERISANVAKAVLGKLEQARLSVTCLVARGHLLLEDIPGVGKTTLAEALARSFSLSFARVQLTADLLPADILGAQVFHPRDSTFEFRPGPLFHQLVLADELNRAPPRTQSALLEAMAQGQVSLDSVTHPLPKPFHVVATQNPADFSGTFPLPDSQLDRFLLRLALGHPSAEVETELLRTRGAQDPLKDLQAVASAEELVSLQRMASEVNVDASVADYAVRLATATRAHPEIERGASTRATLALMSAAKAQALWEARDFVTPGDLRSLLPHALSHRMVLRSSMQGGSERDEAAHLLDEIARKVPAPR